MATMAGAIPTIREEAVAEVITMVILAMQVPSIVVEAVIRLIMVAEVLWQVIPSVTAA